MTLQKEPWIDTRLNQEEMNFLHKAILDENRKDTINSTSVFIQDKDNWFYKTVFKKLTERLFYRDLDNYHKYHIEKEEPPPKFELRRLWINYQKQHDFNPLHSHDGLYSFVVFMKIPTHWKEQHLRAHFDYPTASDFQFVWSEKNSDLCITTNFQLSSEDEGRMLFFPAWLSHQVYPFYGTEEERMTISGNIGLYDPNRPKKQKVPVGEYEEKEFMLKMMENGVESVKEEMKQMKKERENVG